MKTKFYFLAAALILFGTPKMFACDDSTKCIHITTAGSYHYWAGLDIGVNGYMNKTYAIETPSGYDFLELDYARSRSFAWNIAQFNVPLYKNHIQLVTGIGLEWNSYSLRRNVTLDANSNTVSATAENFDFSKNKLKSTWLNAPLLIEFNTNNKDDARSFHFAGGVTLGYNVFRNRLKQEYNLDGQDHERKLKDDFNINPFRYSLTARVGYGNCSLFANYALNTLFKEGKGPSVYPFSAGVSLSFN
jgi:hypothetical protein